MAATTAHRLREIECWLMRIEGKLDILLAHLEAPVPTHTNVVVDEDGEIIERTERGHFKGQLARYGDN